MTSILQTLARLARRLTGKSVPSALTGYQWTGTSYIDSYKRNRNPTNNELIAELKSTAWACASINAAVCANFPPRLYVATNTGQPSPKALTRNLTDHEHHQIRSNPALPPRYARAGQIQEVLDHPLLTLLQRVNPVHNAFDLWELTTLYQEITGSTYWYLDIGPLDIPDQLWILPAQNVTPRRRPDSGNIVDAYDYDTGYHRQTFDPACIIHFRYPDPRDPYLSGMPPLRACFEQVMQASDYAAMKVAIYENKAIPSAVITPETVVGEEERDRLETDWNMKFRRGGSGKVLVAEGPMKVQLLSQSMGDLAALADMKATKEDICNAFHVPLSFLTSETNLANLQAAEHQHMAKAISPRLARRDQKINEQMIPFYDPTGRLFVASEDPVPLNADQTINQMQADMKFGIVTINEIRQARGLQPVAWGDTPWLPLQWAPTDLPQRHLLAPHDSDPHVGRNKPVPPESP